jgi:hypothetical protein
MLQHSAGTRLRKLFPVLTLTLLSAGLVIVPSAAGTLAANAQLCSQTYSVAISNQDPDLWPPGASGSFTLSFTNTATDCESASIGSLSISVPAEWTVTGASAPGWNVVSSLPVASGSTLDLAASSGSDEIAVDDTLEVSVAASASCDAVGGSWSSAGWEATDFDSGPYTTSDSPSVNFDGEAECHLEYIAPPATAEKNVHISSVAGHPNGQAVQVGAFSGSLLLTSFTDNITLAIGTNPGSGTLSPASVSTTGVAADDGVATFSQASLGSALKINASSEGYTLVASTSNTDFASATSDPFDIVDKFVDCAAQSCAGKTSSGGSTGQIDANGGAASFLTISILSAASFDCAGYQEITGLISWKTDSSGNQVGTITADKTLVKKLKPPDRGASHFQVCFSPDPGKDPFIDRSGHTVNPGETGLLPNCTSPTATNCVFSRNKTASGNAVVKFRVADGKGRI